MIRAKKMHRIEFDTWDEDLVHDGYLLLAKRSHSWNKSEMRATTYMAFCGQWAAHETLRRGYLRRRMTYAGSTLPGFADQTDYERQYIDRLQVDLVLGRATGRQRAIAQLVLEGHSHREIAGYIQRDPSRVTQIMRSLSNPRYGRR